uniref:NADP-dependent oxidoreductase domain-containing protein n=1 Tax=Graphocephala atropunctata TaxID=36148 RepID=A0A1B6LCR0_9HEMI
MEKCVESGLVKNIGLSNFNRAQIQRVLDIATIKPVVNQVECHMMLNQKSLIEFCKGVDIVVEAYSPFGSPSRPNAPKDAANVLQDPRLLQVASRYSKTSAQIVLRYLIQLGVVVLPKSVTPERIRQNLQVFDFQLSPEDVSALASLDCGLRLFPYLVAKEHPDYPFVEEPLDNLSIESDPCTTVKLPGKTHIV